MTVTIERSNQVSSEAFQICNKIMKELVNKLFGSQTLKPLQHQSLSLHKKARSPAKAADDGNSPDLAKKLARKARHIQSLPRLDPPVVAEAKRSLKKIPVVQLPRSRMVGPELHDTLKIELLRKHRHPLRDNFKEAAFVLDGILRAVEKGADRLSPRSKLIIYGNGKTPHPAELMRRAKAQREAELRE